MAVPARVSVLAVQVADVARASAFYEALGWPRSPASRAEIAFFGTAGALFAVYGAELNEAMGVPAGPGPGSVIAAVHAADEAGVDEAMATAEAAGGRVVRPGGPWAGGAYAGVFADPDGHLWEVIRNPAYPLGPDGRPVMP
jgi:predicted lactoylglutathione lyase